MMYYRFSPWQDNLHSIFSFGIGAMFLLVMVGMVSSITMSLFPELRGPKDRVLQFTRRILGADASRRLKNQSVTQSIRSNKEIKGLSTGDEVSVTLDSYHVGKARIVSIDRVKLSNLDKDDALKGGFATLEELRSALGRAGFRFLPLERYVENRVQFVWLSPASLPQHYHLHQV